MKNFSRFFILFVLVSAVTSCNSQTSKNSTETISSNTGDAENIIVNYFHYTHRCATCNAVEDVTKEALQNLYGEKISFASYNLDDKETELLASKFKIDGQTLIVIQGDKVIDLTNDAFFYALNNPEKLKEKIKETIDSLM